jgi:hypothetical protein
VKQAKPWRVLYGFAVRSICTRKNRSTIIRDAQEAIIARGLKGHEQDFLDSLYVMETAMQHFYVKAIVAEQNNGKADVIDANFLQAVEIAAKIAPYRHARLSAVKRAGEPNNPARFKDDATADELREKIMHHLGVLVDGGVIDLELCLRRNVGKRISRGAFALVLCQLVPRGAPSHQSQIVPAVPRSISAKVSLKLPWLYRSSAVPRMAASEAIVPLTFDPLIPAS